ncbi:major facilitator superfamily domain-containing protein [Aspergillus germanicus]
MTAQLASATPESTQDIERNSSDSVVKDDNQVINPQDFPERRKWCIMTLVSVTAFLSPLSSSIPAPGIQLTAKDFKVTSQILNSFTISVYVLGFAVGPLILSPMSEAHGRQIILNGANFFHAIWQLAAALSPNLASLIAFRFLAGVGGSACLTIGGGIIADLFPLAQRGKANAMFTVGPLLGPVVGPIIGGFIAQRAGWRWVFWVLFIATITVATVNLVFGQETNHAVLLRRYRQRLQKEGGDNALEDEDFDSKRPNVLTRFLTGITRPMKIVLGSPILLLLTLYLSFIFGLLYLLFTTMTALFTTQYGWPIEFAGLAYIGLGIGFILGIIFEAKTSDATVARLTRANNGVYAPEMRLASCVLAALFIPISFFWYGWSAHYTTQWIVPIIGLAPFGFGMIGIFAPIQTYFIDVSGKSAAASAIAGLVAVRCLFGAFLPLAGPRMYEALGLGWGNSLLGFLALGMTPVPALIYRYGGALREKYPIILS